MPRRRVPRPITGVRNAANRIYETLTRVEALEAKLAETSSQVSSLSAQLERNQEQTLEILLLLRDDEPGTRRLLWQMREAPEYEAAYEEAEPLVSMVIPTYTNTKGLLDVALPSLANQTYERWEAIVVGDAVGPEVEQAVRRFGDERIRFANVTHRGPYPEERHLLWRVAGGPPANEGLRLARGRWIAQMDDDDTLTADHIELLLTAARDRRLEFCYGRVRQHHPDGSVQILCQFPPTPHGVSMTCSLAHAGLRFIGSELGDYLFRMTGDWVRVRRMMRIGVRIGMIDDVVLDYYPAQLWKPEAEPETVTMRGRSIRFRLIDGDSGDQLRSGYETEVLDYIDSLSPDAVFCDLGASIGHFALYAAARGLRTYAFEPDPANFSALLANARANDLDNLAVFECAISDGSSATAVLRSDSAKPRVGDHHKVLETGEFSGDASIWGSLDLATTVESVSLDGAVESGMLPTPTALKVDIDGSEVAFVRGARRTLRDDRLKSVLIELSKTSSEYAAVVAGLEEAGLRRTAEHQVISGIGEEPGLFNVRFDRG